MKHHTFGTKLIILGIVLLCIAAGLAVKNVQEQKQAEKDSQAAMEELLDLLQDTEKNQAADQQKDSSLEDRKAEEIPDYILNPEMDMPMQDISGIPYIGYLDIPALNLQLPVIAETSSRYLRKSPCRFTGSAYLDDLVIGAHNYVRHFRNIGNLSYGDEITFTDMDGNVFAYKVANIEILQPNQGKELCSGEWPLTLYTCTLGGRTRITVRCEKVDEV